jgi:hypothetical protein
MMLKAGFVPVLPMKAAVYYGLFAENNRAVADLQVNCKTGNCTWTPFETLAVCTTEVNITNSMVRHCANGSAVGQQNTTSCGWKLPQGAFLKSGSDVFSMTSFFPSIHGDMPHTTIMKLIFMGTEAQNNTANRNKPWAFEYTLQACIQTISSVVVNGTLNENIMYPTLNKTVINTSKPSLNGYDATIFDTNNNTYTVTAGAMLAMRGWFAVLFQNGSATRTSSSFNRTINDNNVVVNLTVGISSGETFFDTDIITAFYWNYYKYPAGLTMLMSDLATSMTVAFRSFSGAEPVAGSVLSSESYVHVRWVGITVPVVVILLTGLFLVATSLWTNMSKTKIWKSSALAMLFYGLDSETRKLFDDDESFAEKKRSAGRVKVRLDDSGDHGCFLRN